tara:strand:- start:16314 stop:16856 length:543 start_codon:yes stop_codon:yes gene_type:complete
MEIYRTPDIELLMCILPFLPELDYSSLGRYPDSSRSLNLSQGIACKFGLQWEGDFSNNAAAILGVPEVDSATNPDESLFDILLKLRLMKAYMVHGEAAIFIAIKPSLSGDSDAEFYAIRLPVSIQKTKQLSKAKAISLVRMKDRCKVEGAPTKNRIDLNLMIKEARVWEKTTDQARSGHN